MSEVREMRRLTQKKKFKGMGNWLSKKREKERKEQKHQEAIKKKAVEVCREKREVKTCEECLRYEHCYHGAPLYDEEKLLRGEIRLAESIVLRIEDDIRKCWRNGWKSQLEYWLKVLSSEWVEIITANRVDGYASAEALSRWCKREYGDFMQIYEATQKKYKPKLEQLEVELDEAKKKNKKAKVKSLYAQINKVVERLYGNTL